MRIQRMQATFGRLHQQSLDLSPGLNILQAPNESGKSTWCAFLLAMVYGINSRERDKAGFIAEKNRYAPWNGTPMSGSIDCIHDGKPITITRETKRATAPMAGFSATYTGTADDVGYLDAQTCGETLLGVNRDVYERSAFIRQAGLAVGQTPELERRIASLITTGDEESAYSQVLETLKQQRNRRRHNKTGTIPQQEAALQQLQAQQQALQELSVHYQATQAQATASQEALAQLDQTLAQWQAFDSQQQHLALGAEKAAAIQAQAQADALAQALLDDRIPQTEVIAQLRGAIVNISFTQRQVDKAMAEKDNALRQAMAAESALGESPFAGRTPEQAMETATNLPTAKKPLWILPPLVAMTVAGGVYAMTHTLLYGALAGMATLAIGCGLFSLNHRKRTKATLDAYLKRHGVTTPEALAALAQQYAALWNNHTQAAAASAAATAQYNALYETLSTNEQALLLEVRRFAPTAFDITMADDVLRLCSARRKGAQQAQDAAREAHIRWERHGVDIPYISQEDLLPPPVSSKEALTVQRSQAQQTLTLAQHNMAQLEGQRTALGNGDAIDAAMAQCQEAIEQGELEYTAITTAMEALSDANTTLQSRFAPGLGKDTAAIFTRLTQGRYDGVILNRDLHLSTQVDGQALYRDIGLLSAGAADQLYLATRLAICDWILPKNCPIVLDDALTNFDDERCKIALEYLQEVAKERQVLLFTCHTREAQLCDTATVQALG